MYLTSNMNIIETDRLYFREIVENDDCSILELDSDPLVHQYLGNRPIENIIQARNLIQFIRQLRDKLIARITLRKTAHARLLQDVKANKFGI